MTIKPIYIAATLIAAATALSCVIVSSRAGAFNPDVARADSEPLKLTILSAPRLKVFARSPVPGVCEVDGLGLLGHANHFQELSWQLKIWERNAADTEWSVVWEQAYTESFFIPEGTSNLASFSETLHLPSGDYVAELGISDQQSFDGNQNAGGRLIVTQPTPVSVK